MSQFTIPMTTHTISLFVGDMSQFTIPMTTHGNKAFKFEAYEKDNNEDVLMNNQKELIVDPNDAITLMPIVVHKEGKENRKTDLRKRGKLPLPYLVQRISVQNRTPCANFQ